MITIWNRKKLYLKQEVCNDGKNRKAPCMGKDVVLLINLFFWPFWLHSKYYGVQLVPPNFSSSFCFIASVNGRPQFTWHKLFGITFRYDFFGTTFFGMSFWSVLFYHTHLFLTLVDLDVNPIEDRRLCHYHSTYSWIEDSVRLPKLCLVYTRRHQKSN